MYQDLMSVYASHEAAYTGCDVPPGPYVPSPVKMFPTLESKIPAPDPVYRFETMLITDTPQSMLPNAQAIYVLAQFPDRKMAARTALATWIRKLILAAAEAEKVGGPQTYLDFEQPLRWVIQIATSPATRDAARDALNDLYLVQTSNIPERWWMDNYTKDVDEESNGELDTNVLAQKLLHDDEKFDELVASIEKKKAETRQAIAEREGPRRAADLPVSSSDIALRLVEVYGMQEFNGVLLSTLAIKAASGSLSDEDVIPDYDNSDDRKFVPPTLEKSFDPDGDLTSKVDWKAVNGWRDAKKHAWEQCLALAPYKRDQSLEDTLADTLFRQATLVSLLTNNKHRAHLLRTATTMAHYGETQAAAMMVYPFLTDNDNELELAAIGDIQHGIDEYNQRIAIMNDEESWQKRRSMRRAAKNVWWEILGKIRDIGKSTLSTVDFKESEVPDEILSEIELFAEELGERTGGMRKSSDPEVRSVDKYCQMFLKDLSETMPDESSNPTATAAWQLAYSSSIAAGSTAEQAQATAWAAFRQKTSPDGAKAFEDEIQKSHDDKKAMAAFWRLATNAPRKMAEIITVKGDGSGVVIAEPSNIPVFKPLPPLKVKEKDGTVSEVADPEGFKQPVQPEKVKREITWYVADKKLLAGEIDLSKKDRLVEVLNQKKFPYARYFIDHLARM